MTPAELRAFFDPRQTHAAGALDADGATSTDRAALWVSVASLVAIVGFGLESRRRRGRSGG